MTALEMQPFLFMLIHSIIIVEGPFPWPTLPTKDGALTIDKNDNKNGDKNDI